MKKSVSVKKNEPTTVNVKAKEAKSSVASSLTQSAKITDKKPATHCKDSCLDSTKAGSDGSRSAKTTPSCEIRTPSLHLQRSKAALISKTKTGSNAKSATLPRRKMPSCSDKSRPKSVNGTFRSISMDDRTTDPSKSAVRVTGTRQSTSSEDLQSSRKETENVTTVDNSRVCTVDKTEKMINSKDTSCVENFPLSAETYRSADSALHDIDICSLDKFELAVTEEDYKEDPIMPSKIRQCVSKDDVTPEISGKAAQEIKSKEKGSGNSKNAEKDKGQEISIPGLNGSELALQNVSSSKEASTYTLIQSGLKLEDVIFDVKTMFNSIELPTNETFLNNKESEPSSSLPYVFPDVASIIDQRSCQSKDQDASLDTIIDRTRSENGRHKSTISSASATYVNPVGNTNTTDKELTLSRIEDDPTNKRSGQMITTPASLACRHAAHVLGQLQYLHTKSGATLNKSPINVSLSGNPSSHAKELPNGPTEENENNVQNTKKTTAELKVKTGIFQPQRLKKSLRHGFFHSLIEKTIENNTELRKKETEGCFWIDLDGDCQSDFDVAKEDATSGKSVSNENRQAEVSNVLEKASKLSESSSSNVKPSKAMGVVQNIGASDQSKNAGLTIDVEESKTQIEDVVYFLGDLGKQASVNRTFTLEDEESENKSKGRFTYFLNILVWRFSNDY